MSKQIIVFVCERLSDESRPHRAASWEPTDAFASRGAAETAATCDRVQGATVRVRPLAMTAEKANRVLGLLRGLAS